MSQPIDWSALTLKVDETTTIVPCMCFVLFLDLTEDKSVLDFYLRSREALGDRITHYQAESMAGYSKVNARANAMVPTWFTQPRKGKLDYYMSMAEGDPGEVTTAVQFEVTIFRRPASEWTGEAKTKELAKHQKAYEENRIIGPRGASLLRVTFPIDHPLADPVRFVDWISEFEIVRGKLPFTGYGGFAINFYGPERMGIYQATQKLLAALLLRHPGFDWEGGGVLPRLVVYRSDPPGFRMLTKRVNWLNLLSEQVVTELGGTTELRSQLEADQAVTVRAVGTNLIVQAGAEPQIGDTGHRDFVPPYRHVEKILRPARIDEISGLGANFGKELTNEWLNAFMKEYD